MTVNLPPKLRLSLYIATGVLSPVVAYLLAKGLIGQLEMSLWLAEVSFISLLAAFNVKES